MCVVLWPKSWSELHGGWNALAGKNTTGYEVSVRGPWTPLVTLMWDNSVSSSVHRTVLSATYVIFDGYVAPLCPFL